MLTLITVAIVHWTIAITYSDSSVTKTLKNKKKKKKKQKRKGKGKRKLRINEIMVWNIEKKLFIFFDIIIQNFKEGIKEMIK